MDNQLPLKLILSIILGAFIGWEREYHQDEIAVSKKKRHANLGVRTFSLTTLLGTAAAFLYSQIPAAFILTTGAFFFLVISNYVIGSLQTKDSGTTTELASIFAYLLGAMLAWNVIPIQLTIALTVVITLILSRKAEVKQLVARLRRFETNAFINYAVIALVILPFLPNHNYTIGEIPFLTTFLSAYQIDLGRAAAIQFLNPYRLWFLVALITGIDVLGYSLSKAFGSKKGWFLSSITGGFVSSTATTQALANQSKFEFEINRLVSAAIFANLASFFQLFLLIAPINPQFLTAVTPFLTTLILSAFACGGLFLILEKREVTRGVNPQISQATSVFRIQPALKFALIFSLVSFVAKLALVFLGTGGLILTSALAAITGLDAVIINISELARTTVTVQNAIWAMVVANTVNLAVKAVYALRGKREFALKFGGSILFIIIISWLGVLLINK